MNIRVVVARTAGEVLRLEPAITTLLKQVGREDDLTLTPAYCLAVLAAKRAKPYVLAVYESEATLIGIIYAGRRCLWGCPIGVVESGDPYGDGSVLSTQGRFNDVVKAGISAMLSENFIRLARVSWNSAICDNAVPPQLEEKLVTRRFNREVSLNIPLEPTYDCFLEKLGSQTRRNMRYYRRAAEREGWVFEGIIGSDEAALAVTHLYPLQQVGHEDRAELSRCERKLRDVHGSFFSGIRTPAGEWISLAGGWVRGSAMFILFQMNDARYARASLSTVLRSYLIERAILSGVRSIRFIGGCEGSLRKYCTPEKAVHFLVRKPDYLGNLIATGVCRLFPSSVVSGLLSDTTAIYQ